MNNFNQESVLSVHHWTDNLFSFTTTRNPSFRFRNGEFTMIGLKVNEKPLLHGCRRVAELAYGETITEKLPNDDLIGELVRNQLIYYPTVTRDPFRNRGRITDLMTSGKLFSDVGLAPLAPEHDRVMICGSPALVHDTRTLLSAKGFVEGNHGEPGHFVVEKAFAER